MKRLSLTAWIFIAMVLGVALGVTYPDIAKADWMAALANVFLRLIGSIIAPLLFGTLVYGIAGTGNLRTMGRIGLKAMIYFEVLTTIALFLGLAAVNLVRPGDGLTLAGASATNIPQSTQTLGGILEHTFPSSVIDAMARGDVLQIVVFSFLFGAACAAIGAKAKPVVDFCHSLADVMLKYTTYVMYFAPIGVGAAVARAIGTNGAGVLLSLGKLVLTLYAALAIFIAIFIGASLIIARIPIGPFVSAVREPCMIAFSTASSEAALPLALENMEQLGVPPHIVAFVLPTGYSFNLMGSAIYLSLAVMFIAQAASIHLPLTQQLLIMLTLMLTSKGLAGIPRASIVILKGTLTSFGLPISGIGLLLGADAIMDMARTFVNVLGNCVATAVVARWEGTELGDTNLAAAQSADPLALHAGQGRSTPAN